MEGPKTLNSTYFLTGTFSYFFFPVSAASFPPNAINCFLSTGFRGDPGSAHTRFTIQMIQMTSAAD
jgi:hypothetical protein